MCPLTPAFSTETHCSSFDSFSKGQIGLLFYVFFFFNMLRSSVIYTAGNLQTYILGFCCILAMIKSGLSVECTYSAGKMTPEHLLQDCFSNEGEEFTHSHCL